jgi:hypothetical protein
MALLATGSLPRKGQSVRIDGHLAIHTGHGEFHLVDERGETVMKEGRTYTLVTRGRMNEFLSVAATLEGGVGANVRTAADPSDSWISGTIAARLDASGLLVHVLNASAAIELIEPERPPAGFVLRINGSALVEEPDPAAARGS